MSSIPTVTIGVPAYNEEARIESVLRAIHSQKQQGWKLESIMVILDGCTDQSVPLVQKLATEIPSINPIIHETQKGKTQGLQELFLSAKGEIIVMFDADISFHNDAVVSELVIPFVTKNADLVGGNSRPETPRNFFQKCVSVSFSIFEASRLHHLGGNNIFCATGSCLAIRSSFAQTIQFPKIVNEDSYLYILCKWQNRAFLYQPSAIVEYLLPSTARDYVKQLLRSTPAAVESELAPYFPAEFLQRELTRNRWWYTLQVGKNTLQKPIETLVIVGLNILVLPLLRVLIHRYHLSWFTAKSTHIK